MAKDDFDDNDLADLSRTEAAPTEISAESEDAIGAALERFYGKDDSGPAEEKEAVDPAIADRRAARNRQRTLDEKEELAADGVENADDPNEPVVDETPADAEKPAEETEKAVEQVKPAAEETPIDPTLRYFAETELGLDPKSLDIFFKADPQGAATMLTKLVDSHVNLSRQSLQSGSPLLAGTPVVQPPAQPASPTSKLDELYANLSAFAEVNGEDITEKFLKPLKAELIDPVREILAANKAREQDLDKTETVTSFNGLKEKFGDLYGKDEVPSNAEQNEARQKLGLVADQLRAGAKAAGKPITIGKAIRDAHLVVSAEYRDAIVRRSIKEQVQKRANAITAKPTQRKNPVASSSRSTEAASEALAKKAAELGLAGFDE